MVPLVKWLESAQWLPRLWSLACVFQWRVMRFWVRVGLGGVFPPASPTMRWHALIYQPMHGRSFGGVRSNAASMIDSRFFSFSSHGVCGATTSHYTNPTGIMSNVGVPVSTFVSFVVVIYFFFHCPCCYKDSLRRLGPSQSWPLSTSRRCIWQGLWLVPFPGHDSPRNIWHAHDIWWDWTGPHETSPLRALFWLKGCHPSWGRIPWVMFGWLSYPWSLESGVSFCCHLDSLRMVRVPAPHTSSLMVLTRLLMNGDGGHCGCMSRGQRFCTWSRSLHSCWYYCCWSC